MTKGPNIFSKYSKRLFDVVASGIGLILLAPVVALAAVAVRLSSPGPILFAQIRIGRHGKPFRCLKFRTMVVGADRHGSVTTGGDSRIIPAGRFLRRYRLDELPQLCNVFKGDMSFVGPRPDVPGYADSLTGEERLILEVRPGITGPATLVFRREGDLLDRSFIPQRYNDTVIYPLKTRINIDYVQNVSFWRDIGYILVTFCPRLDRWLQIRPCLHKDVKDEIARIAQVANTLTSMSVICPLQPDLCPRIPDQCPLYGQPAATGTCISSKVREFGS